MVYLLHSDSRHSRDSAHRYCRLACVSEYEAAFFMFVRAVTLTAITIAWLLGNQSLARGETTQTGDSIIVLNHQIASMIRTANAPIPVQPVGPPRPSAQQGLSPRTAVDQRKPDWLSNPTFLSMAARFTSAERILHYRHAGFDANFWGIVNRGRGIRVRFFVRL